MFTRQPTHPTTHRRHPSTARRGLVATAGLTGILLTACGATLGPGPDPHADHGGRDVVDGATVVDVRAEALTFAPSRIELRAGQEVNVRLTSVDTLHDLTLEAIDLHVRADAGSASSAGLRVDEPGTYVAFCTVPGHREAGMELTLEVAP